MLNSKVFSELLFSKGFNFFTGLLSGLISIIDDDPKTPYYPAVREDAAVGLCAGAYLAGKLPVLLMQNSGLGYCLNAFTSLNLIYKIPVLVIMSWRGEDSTDAPEHIIMGEINQNLLNTCGMEYSVISSDNYKASLNTAIQQMEKGLPYTLMVGKGYFNEGH